MNRYALLLVAIACALAVPVLKPIAPAVARTFQPRTTAWSVKSSATPSDVRTIFVALKERNIAELKDIALEISDPDSSSYGQQLNFQELIELTAPVQQNVDKVLSWVRSSGIQDVEVLPAGGFIRLQASNAQIESLLQCTLKTYAHSSNEDKTIVRSETPYFVPSHLHDIIDFVAPIHGFPMQPVARFRPSIKAAATNPDADPVDSVTPAVLRSRYNVTTPVVNEKVNNTQAVFEIQESILDSDLQQFYQQFAPKLAGQKVKKFLGDGGNDPSDVGTESSLDIQYIAGLGGFAPNYYYNYNEDDVYAAFYKYAVDLVNDPRPPLVQSISYGQYGGDYPIGEVDRISDEFMKLGTRGVSIMVASGDDGAGCNDDETQFEFPYPSTPWVTFLGSTQLQTRSDGTYTEIGSTFSSGGFSNDFGIPSWQSKAVARFLQTPNLPTSYFNASGRALPDVSVAGENFQVVVSGSVTSVDGTSCSAPSFGGIISVINGLRLKANKKPLGFINPLLYKAAELTTGRAYFDVVSGNNGYGGCPGFNAVKGWDPVTGLGTPNYPVLAAYALSL